MSTPQTHPPTKPGQLPPAKEKGRREIRIVQHSPILYWWPVWAFGFLMALFTWGSETRMVVLPHRSAFHAIQDDPQDSKKEQVVIEIPKGKRTQSLQDAEEHKDDPSGFPVHMADSPYPGMFWFGVLLAVIIITNIPLRGMWSWVVIGLIVVAMAFISILRGWTPIIDFFQSFLHIHLNMGGYLFLSSVLFLVWLITVFFFDRQVYMLCTPRLLKVREAIGGGEIAHDTTGMVVQKHRDDLFRHWILGLGSGDLVVRTAGANSHEYHFHNVLGVGWRLAQIEDMIREVEVAK
jgi:hypothetical protein